MLSLVDSRQMMDLDEKAVRQFGMPSILLMENAGRSVIEEIERRFGSIDGAAILVVSGKGKNGGDGFVAARHAVQRGADVTVLFLGNQTELQGDVKSNYDVLKNAVGTRLTLIRSFKGKEFSRTRFDYIIDAIFGTSFHGEIHGKFKTVVEWINSQNRSKIIAVDIPSGVNASTGECSSAFVRAHLTVTMALPKVGLFLGKGREATGSVAVADIQMPAPLMNQLKSQQFLVEEKDVQQGLPVRSIEAHKQSVGKILILAGSKGLTGAALLCSESAMRSGAGAVALGIPSAIFSAVSRRTLEVMPFELPSTAEGSAASSSMESIVPKMKWADVILIGPGLSQNPETVKLVQKIIATSNKTLVIDADGLNALAKNISLLKKRKCKSVILTPHLGEFSRLSGLQVEEIEKNKIEIARSFARKNNVVLVLKGAPTIVADPEGDIYINPTGNPGMATAGSGDVLGGVIAALVGQHNTPVQAAINGVYVHGRSGDIARDDVGEMGMLASDIMRRIPTVLKYLQENRFRVV
jgi:ADP-dependent NAD(P)H-hydrate dehydratase / NAD(P)H-hydrate epimerase